jgi:hypothetical protein
MIMIINDVDNDLKLMIILNFLILSLELQVK